MYAFPLVFGWLARVGDRVFSFILPASQSVLDLLSQIAFWKHE